MDVLRLHMNLSSILYKTRVVGVFLQMNARCYSYQEIGIIGRYKGKMSTLGSQLRESGRKKWRSVCGEREVALTLHLPACTF